ncbi:MAG: SMC-Scp complex subunit ScpB, partial [Deltaproteobacteria bacterium]|nr:SMC-Scp complex subunit ScpB [Deltaproteobacteria bacterium]
QERIREVTKLDESVVESALKLLEEHYREAGRGFELVQAAGQYQFRTRACFAPHVQALKVDRPRRLTNAALETLAVIAYRQPIVKSDIEKIRGVDATPTLKTLLDRELIRIMGHKAAVGQPALYGTTERFLKLFGLNSLGELPTLRDLKDLENDPGEAGERLGELESEGSDEVVEQDEDMSGVAAQP